MEDRIFKEQILEDISLIQENVAWDPSIKKDDYAFNYWILSNLYSLDIEDCNNYITEYNDKGIDCFVHFEEDKELYIIQNKFYGDDTNLSSKDISDFITRPIAKLNEGTYTRNTELQRIFTLAKADKSYKIFLHFYISNNNSKIADVQSLINNYNDPNIMFSVFFLDDIKLKYFGESYKQSHSLKTTLKLKVKSSCLSIRPQQYSLPNMSEAYYVMAKITDIYNLWKDAENKDYPLFEQNIREYLGGTSGINKGIINTLRDPSQRGNFFYYNNGITVICNSAKADAKKVDISNPQIVNGCQTVNSIAEVLKTEKNLEETFGDVYVMTKILVIEKDKDDDKIFSRDIVRFTNSQNSINEKVFGATLQPFFTIKEKLKNHGILLNVKQSDKFQNKDDFSNRKDLNKALLVANSKSPFFKFSSLNDMQLDLETLIQIIGAFKKDAFFSYTKKSMLLKPTSKEYYQDFSTKIGDFYTFEAMYKLILLYKKAEYDKKNSSDKKSPSPYYLLNFISYYLKLHRISKQEFLKNISYEDLGIIYDRFKSLSTKYLTEYKLLHGLEYNEIIKKEVDYNIVSSEVEKHFKAMQEYSPESFQSFESIIRKFKRKDEA